MSSAIIKAFHTRAHPHIRTHIRTLSLHGGSPRLALAPNLPAAAVLGLTPKWQSHQHHRRHLALLCWSCCAYWSWSWHWWSRAWSGHLKAWQMCLWLQSTRCKPVTMQNRQCNQTLQTDDDAHGLIQVQSSPTWLLLLLLLSLDTCLQRLHLILAAFL